MRSAERRREIEEAVRDAVEGGPLTPAQQRTARRAARRDRRPLAVAVLLAGWAVLAWVWLARPAFVFGPPPAPPLTASQREATLRFALFLERGRVDAYVAAHGQLPGALDQAGPVEDSVSWQRTSDGYALHGHWGDTELVLTSRMDADSFLGDAVSRLPPPRGAAQ